MKKLLLALLISPLIAFAQTFDGPESVEYDAVNQRWLVSQNSSGEVLAYSPSSGTLTTFCSGMNSGPYGIEILGNVLYCCDGSRVKGYDLSSGAQVSNVNLGANFLNGITSDGISNLFVTDFSAKKIYRLNATTNAFNVMATILKTPNGIIYDAPLNRLVYVTWGSNAPVQALSLSDSTVSTLTPTTLTNLDGIVRDAQGNWYVSSWGSSSLHKFDATFTTTPEVVKTGLSSPADLGINAAGDSIGIPNSGNLNNVVFYAVPQNCDTPIISTFILPPSCHGQTALVTVNPTMTGGIPPYTFAWSNGVNDYHVTVLVGTYTVTVTDSIGCSASAEVVVPEPSPLSPTFTATPDTAGTPCNGAIVTSMSGGTAPYSFQWSPNIDSLPGLCSGWYFVTVADDNGCFVVDSVFIDSISITNYSVIDNDLLVEVYYHNGSVTMNFSRTPSGASVALVDMMGRELLDEKISGKSSTLKCSHLPAGCYSIVVRSKSKIANHRQKIILH